MSKDILNKILESHREACEEAAANLKQIQEDDSLTSDEKFDKMAVILSNLRFKI